MKLSRNIPNLTKLLLAATVFVHGAQAQSTKEAISSGTITQTGLGNTNEIYAEWTSSFFNYGLAEFQFSQADFGDSEVLDISSATLELTINDRSFSAAGDFYVLFTADSKADLSDTGDYDQVIFNQSSTYGIDPANYTYVPVSVGTGVYPYSGYNGGGEKVYVTLDLSTIKSDLIDAINADESFHILIGTTLGGTIATFSGIGNTFDPGTPRFTIVAGDATPEPSEYPSSFIASATNTFIELSWTDSSGTTPPLGYVVMANTTGTFTPPVDGTTVSVDSDLSDGSAVITVEQGVQSATFGGLAENTQYFFTIYPYTNLPPDIDYKTDATPPTANATTGTQPVATTGDIIITQYYEGTASNKYLELANISDHQVDVSGWILVRWSNENDQDFKTATTLPSTGVLDLSPLGVLEPGQVVILADADALSPISAGEADLSQAYAAGGAISHNGDDSAAIYSSSTPSPVTLVDVIPFTSAREGGEISFVRISTDPGYDLDTGADTSVLDFPSVWVSVPYQTVDAATPGQDAHLGTSLLVDAEPSVSFLLSSLKVSEDDGTASIDVIIRNPDGNAVSVDVAFDSGSSTAVAADIGSYTTQTVTFSASAADLDIQTVTVNITNDALEETQEDAYFSLENLVTTGVVTIGEPNALILSIEASDVAVPSIFISEVADPGDIANAKYVELYNAGSENVDLSVDSWYLIRYSNGGTTGGNVALTGIIPAGGTYVIAYNAGSFATAFPSITPDQVSGNVSGNGNDAYELRMGGDASTGLLIDIYGEVGVDGSGTAWEYTDSHAVRNPGVTSPSATWIASQWTITAAGTAEMDPGTHTGSVATPEPAEQASGFTASLVDDATINVSWTDAAGDPLPDGYLLLANTTGSFSDPVDGVEQADDYDLSDGSAIVNVGYGVEEVQFDSLSLETTYYFKLFAYTNSGSSTDYLIASAPTADATTPSPLPDIVLSVESPFSDEITEGATTTVTVTLSAAAPSGGLTVALESSDTNELTVPSSISFAEGEDTKTFTATAISDGIYDADAVVTITASATGYNTDTLPITVINLQAFATPLLITQYYDGAYTPFVPPLQPEMADNHIEITNISNSPVTLTSAYSLTLWKDANRDGWKSGGTASVTYSLDGITIPAGASIVIESPSATSPSYLPGTYQNADVTAFDGDDSIVLFGPGSSGIIVYDALVFASGGDTDMTTLVRLSAAAGFDTLSGTSSAVDYPSVWDDSTFTIANVDSASASDNEYLGFFVLPTIDEPAEHATSLVASATGTSSISVTWTDGAGDPAATGYLLLASTADSFSTPVDGTPVATDADIGDGSVALNLSPGLEAVDFTGLSSGTTYYFRLYAYTNSGTAIDFKTDGTIPSASATTDSLDAVQTWLADNGLTTADLNDDDDFDGLPVILEYLDDGDPDVANALLITVELNGSGQLVLVWTSTRATEPDGVTIDLTGSDDVTVWGAVGYTYAVADNGDGTYAHRYTQTTALDSGGKPFLSLSVLYTGS